MNSYLKMAVSLCLVSAALAPIDARGNGFGAHPAVPTSGYGHLDRSGANEHLFRSVVQGGIVGGFLGYAVSKDRVETDDFGAVNDRVPVGVRVIAGIGVGAVAGGALPFALNGSDSQFRSGDVVFINVAQNWGFAHGFAVPAIFQLSRYADGATEGDLRTDDLRLSLAISAGTSLLAGGVASYFAKDLNFEPGHASAIGSAGLWGAFAGFAFTRLVGPGPQDSTIGWQQAMLSTMLVTANAAMLGAWYFRDQFSMDRSRVVALDIGGIGGAAAGAGVAYLIDPRIENGPVLAASILVGAISGLAISYGLTGFMDGYKKSAPVEGDDADPLGAGALVNFVGRHWAIGVPTPRPTLRTDVNGKTKLSAILSLVDGRF